MNDFQRLHQSFLGQGISEDDLTVIGKEQLAELEAQVDRDSQRLYDLSKENHDLRNRTTVAEGEKEELDGWAQAIWMAFLAEEETHELTTVLQNFSAWMMQKKEEAGGQ